MSEFTFLFRGRDRSGSPEQLQRTMQQWVVWMKQLAETGNIADPGHPLENDGKLVSGKRRAISDGPYAEIKDLVSGFMVIEARDIQHAVELAKGCPIFEDDGSVEVRPLLKLNI